MRDRIMWKMMLSIIFTAGLILYMTISAVMYIENIEKNRHVWLHKDVRWKTCTCSTEMPEFLDICREFLSECNDETFNESDKT